ncbi:fructose-specific PTS transporter subunit EIIC [Photobacterium makurazakiensis]|uniref:PTS fructose transporter subunit IIABC n=1 Tax=Photobacterium makurazakiensis TaxID=2910234 RepID=UPI003D11B911
MITSLINENLMCLDLKVTTKNDVFDTLSEILLREGKINDKAQFVADLQAREAQGCTGFEDGIAIPHAKSKAVVEPAVVIGICQEGIDYGSEDGLPSKLFFMIASPDGGADHHIEVLAELSSKLIEDGFVDALLAANTTAEALALLLEEKKSVESELAANDGPKGFVIGVTGCPAGVAHTYLAAESLEKAAAELGYEIKVETNGSIGIKNSPSAEEIARADAIIVACDKQVDMNRFAGKRLVKTGVKEPIKRGKQLIENALQASSYQAQGSTQTDETALKTKATSALYTYLMNGVSYMIPFVVTGGLLIALSLAIGGVPTEQGMQIPEGSFWQPVLDVGVVAFTLMIPILAGYIAYAVGDRPALAPGLIGGWIANNGSFYGSEVGTGFIGAIIAGLLVGYFVRWVTSINYPKVMQPLVPIIIAPLSGTFFIAVIFITIIGAPVAGMIDSMNAMLVNMSGGNIIILGMILGAMSGFDMGGPVNKVAFLFGVGMIASGQTQFMGALACAFPVPPLAMWMSTVIGRKMGLFDQTEIEAGKAAGAMGFVGIGEGAIPFAVRDPLTVIPANVIGSMVACVMAFLFGITNTVAHGGPIVALLGAMNKPVIAVMCMLVGAIVTCLITISLKKYRLVKSEAAELQVS